ncbi:hypothetical protein B0H10DRAFT_2020314, partial [Mycena sp. CBHHK59/15]
SLSLRLDTLPPELLLGLPQYLYSIEDLHSLFSTCRTLYRTCSNPDPKYILRLAANSGRVFFRPHPHLLIAATARQVADWAVQSDDRRALLEVAVQGGVEKLLELAIDVAGLTLHDIRKMHADVINPLDRQLDLAIGPASGRRPMTVCNDPETTLFSWAIYGELFHHSLELAYLPLPQYKPLSSVIRYNCMLEATRQQLNPEFWMKALQVRLPESVTMAKRKQYATRVMHMGLKSLEVLLPGGVQKLSEDLELIASGMVNVEDDETEQRLLDFVGDPWLWTPYVTLNNDMEFSLWGFWNGDSDPDLLMAAIRGDKEEGEREY